MTYRECSRHRDCPTLRRGRGHLSALLGGDLFGARHLLYLYGALLDRVALGDGPLAGPDQLLPGPGEGVRELDAVAPAHGRVVLETLLGHLRLALGEGDVLGKIAVFLTNVATNGTITYRELILLDRPTVGKVLNVADFLEKID